MGKDKQVKNLGSPAFRYVRLVLYFIADLGDNTEREYKGGGMTVKKDIGGRLEEEEDKTVQCSGPRRMKVRLQLGKLHRVKLWLHETSLLECTRRMHPAGTDRWRP